MIMTNSKSATVLVNCGKCGGNGRYYFAGGRWEACFPCEGEGKIRMSRAKHARLLVAKERLAARWEESCAREAAEERAREESYFSAREVIEELGLDGARAYFRDHRADRLAIEGLIPAMRELGYHEEANAVVRYILAADRAQRIAA